MLTACLHNMCKQCFTSSLNIVGEKRFACPECGEPIQDFKFLPSSKKSLPPASRRASTTSSGVPATPHSAKPSRTFFNDSTNAMDNVDNAQFNVSELAVLRLDDVPWDVTPNMLSAWAGIPPYQAHVLLDRDGKTSSHAYIEAKAGTGEGSAKDVLVVCRNKVLGAGKRARRVTITMSSQDELLKDVG